MVNSKNWYQLTEAEVLEKLGTSVNGLSHTRVAELQVNSGKNQLKEFRRKSALVILLSQFKDIMIIILFLAAAISVIVGEHTDAAVILAIIVANAWMGFSQESKAEESLRLLQEMAPEHALVIREGNPVQVESADLVPGDVILLEAGDIVPADARLLEASSLKTEEAALTGESHSMEKATAPIAENDLNAGDQLNMVFKGTMVSNGSAKAVITATGMQTEIGKIAGMLDVGPLQTPLQKRLAVFSKQLAVVVFFICLIVFGFGLWRGEPPFLMFLTALSLAVAALPEALPAVITIALAKGARRMVKQNALVRKLPAVETLGSVTYICSDKTGTLTRNVMRVEKIHAHNEQDDLLRHAMLLNNEVRFSGDGNMLGDSTETALVQYALGSGFSRADSIKRFPFYAKVPFDSIRMRMSTIHNYEGRWILLVKGAPAKVVEVLGDKYKDQIQGWLDQNREWASEGMRVLFFAYRILDERPEKINESLEHDLDFLGMAAMIDPPREEVIEALKECKTAGIKTVMITGDQALTAGAIARRLHMVDADSSSTLTGAELGKLAAGEFNQAISKVFVYARVSPAQKLEIVKALQSNGEFVAMTGDGVNDAPSLKQADIGVAMGITGTGVSKEAADMILLDDNFATIVRAVKEGRRIYENIRKFILYVLSCNLAEILTIFFAPVLGLAIPLLPTHILWINLVTDGLPGLALVGEPAEKNIMEQPPRSPKENLFAGGLMSRIVLTGALMALATIITQVWAERNGYEVRLQQTMVFTVLCFIQLGNALSVRSARQQMFTSALFANRGMWGSIILTVTLQLMIIYVPVLQSIFKTGSLDWNAMRAILLVSVITTGMIELVKYFSRKRT